mmetsp:Transcript_3148/g.19415  ORF Transcript_3148/g.19415 Transcript_3148/m.19415 type:complete len:215 (+) Transcript_3148:954-1598(+)
MINGPVLPKKEEIALASHFQWHFLSELCLLESIPWKPNPYRSIAELHQPATINVWSKGPTPTVNVFLCMQDPRLFDHCSCSIAYILQGWAWSCLWCVDGFCVFLQITKTYETHISIFDQPYPFHQTSHLLFEEASPSLVRFRCWCRAVRSVEQHLRSKESTKASFLHRIHLSSLSWFVTQPVTMRIATTALHRFDMSGRSTNRSQISSRSGDEA